MFSPKSILVTGAAGFIGCNFVRMMLNQYDNIRIISYDKLTYAGSLDNLCDVMDNPRHTFIKGDICDKKLVANVLREHQVDTIVHFAAESHVDNSIESPDIFIQTNINGTFNLLEQAKRYWVDEKHLNKQLCRFHHISTDEVYGSLKMDEPAFTEESKYQPNSPYSASKAASDHLVHAYHKTYGLPITLSSCSNNYGPYQHEEKLIPVVIQCCIDNKQIPVYGNGTNIRDWLHVIDHCSAVDTILRKGQVGEKYNIGGNCELSNLELIKQICLIFDQQIPERAPHHQLITFVDDRKGHDWRYAINPKKCQTQLGWNAQSNLPDILSMLVLKKLQEQET